MFSLLFNRVVPLPPSPPLKNYSRRYSKLVSRVLLWSPHIYPPIANFSSKWVANDPNLIRPWVSLSLSRFTFNQVGLRIGKSKGRLKVRGRARFELFLLGNNIPSEAAAPISFSFLPSHCEKREEKLWCGSNKGTPECQTRM